MKNWNYRDKEGIFEVLEERNDWEKKEDEVFMEQHEWALIGEIDKVEDYLKEEQGIRWNKNTAFKLDFERDFHEKTVDIAGSRFRVKLIVRVLGFILDNKKDRLTLKNDEGKMLKKYTGESIYINVDCRDSNFYPVLVRFDKISVAAAVAPKKIEEE